MDDHDQILSWLRERLEGELHAQSGHSHEIFQDVKELKIGQDWDGELNQGLQDADFLIPIITPTFLNSEPCRGEVKKFLKREQTERTPDLTLPIYWITSPYISDEALRSADPVAQEIAKHQWDDWREHRLLPRGDSQWRHLTAKLAGAMLSRHKDYVLRALTNANIVGKIHWPEDGDRVFREVRVKGSVEGPPPHCQLWIAVVAGGKLHPQSRITPEAGKWSGKARIGSGGVNSSTGEIFGLQLLAVSPETGDAFSRYLTESGEAKNWNGIKPQVGCKCIHEIKVIRDDQAASGSLEGVYQEYTQGPTGVTVTIKATADPNCFETTATRPNGKPWYGTMTIDDKFPDRATGTYGYKSGVVEGEHRFTINRSKGEINVSGKVKNAAGTTFKTMWRRK